MILNYGHNHIMIFMMTDIKDPAMWIVVITV